MSTRAIQFLKQRAVEFELIRYNHEGKGAVFAAEAIGFALGKTVKTLIVEVGKGDYTMALMPGHLELSMKKVAAACRAKRAAMVKPEEAERLTGYKVGGISPFGIRRSMPVVMEQGLLQFEKVAINAGQRGLMLIINPVTICNLTGSVTAAIAHREPRR